MSLSQLAHMGASRQEAFAVTSERRIGRKHQQQDKGKLHKLGKQVVALCRHQGSIGERLEAPMKMFLLRQGAQVDCLASAATSTEDLLQELLPKV